MRAGSKSWMGCIRLSLPMPGLEREVDVILNPIALRKIRRMSLVVWDCSNGNINGTKVLILWNVLSLTIRRLKRSEESAAIVTSWFSSSGQGAEAGGQASWWFCARYCHVCSCCAMKKKMFKDEKKVWRGGQRRLYTVLNKCEGDNRKKCGRRETKGHQHGS